MHEPPVWQAVLMFLSPFPILSALLAAIFCVWEPL
jgi:hypothetical protein